MPATPPPSEHDDALIDRGGHLTHWFITQITSFLAPEPGKIFGKRYLRWLIRDYLLPAEAVLRRALHLIAERLPPLAPLKPSPNKTAHPRAGGDPGRAKPKPRTPLFRLTEPQPRPPANYLPESRRPRISIPGITPAPARPAAARASAEQIEARLRRRLAALQAAWDDPGKAALRLQRLRARGAVRHPALSFTRIPGARARTLNDIAAPILRDLNNTAFTFAAASRLAPADTS